MDLSAAARYEPGKPAAFLRTSTVDMKGLLQFISYDTVQPMGVRIWVNSTQEEEEEIHYVHTASKGL